MTMQVTNPNTKKQTLQRGEGKRKKKKKKGAILTLGTIISKENSIEETMASREKNGINYETPYL